MVMLLLRRLQSVILALGSFLRSSVLKYANFNEDTTSRYYDYFALSGSMSATCFYA